MPGLSFRPLLIDAGLDPTHVNLLRHCPPGVLDPAGAWKADLAAFEAYQSVQKINSRSYFSRPFWASFTPTRDGRTLFIGLYEARLEGSVPSGSSYALTGELIDPERVERYVCTLRPELSEFIGRLVIDWGPGTRSWGQKGTTDKPSSSFSGRMKSRYFPAISKSSNLFLRSQPCRTGGSISFVRAQGKGIYLLTCPRTKEQYVGKADGADGFWGRWLSYALTGDGGNVRLKSRERSDYQVSILEVAGSAATADEILRMEMRWKAKLQTREMGLNGN